MVENAPKSKKTTIIGWRETVGLPELGIVRLRAKIDTGARTSALHAVDLVPIERDGIPWIEFNVPLAGEPRTKRYAAPIADEREIKNTSGKPERRYVIKLVLVMGNRHWHIDVSLADREKMKFDMILGRTAIRSRKLFVDPGKSFLLGPPTWKPKPTESVEILGHVTDDHPTNGDRL